MQMIDPTPGSEKRLQEFNAALEGIAEDASHITGIATAHILKCATLRAENARLGRELEEAATLLNILLDQIEGWEHLPALDYQIQERARRIIDGVVDRMVQND